MNILDVLWCVYYVVCISGVTPDSADTRWFIIIKGWALVTAGPATSITNLNALTLWESVKPTKWKDEIDFQKYVMIFKPYLILVSVWSGAFSSLWF